MKKKVTNTHKEPIVLSLLRPRGRCKHPQRANENLNVGASRVVDESEISPEMEKLWKRKKLKIEDVAEDVAPTKAAEAKPAPKKKEAPPSEEKSIEELEKELLEVSSEDKPLDD
jgi:hypothetical protein